MEWVLLLKCITIIFIHQRYLSQGDDLFLSKNNNVFVKEYDEEILQTIKPLDVEILFTWRFSNYMGIFKLSFKQIIKGLFEREFNLSLLPILVFVFFPKQKNKNHYQ